MARMKTLGHLFPVRGAAQQKILVRFDCNGQRCLGVGDRASDAREIVRALIDSNEEQRATETKALRRERKC